MIKCSECGNEVDNTAEFCPNCGTKLDKSEVVETVQDQTVQDQPVQVQSVQDQPVQVQSVQDQSVQNQEVSSQNTKFCSNCGSKIDVKAEICPNCGVRVAGASEIKSPFLALILSFLFPGLGQFYNGHSKKGIILIVAAIVSIILYLLLIGLILYLIVWVYGLYDAYKSAEAINNGINVPDEISLNF